MVVIDSSGIVSVSFIGEDHPTMERIPPVLRWFSGLNVLVLMIDILCIGISNEQQKEQVYPKQIEKK